MKCNGPTLALVLRAMEQCRCESSSAITQTFVEISQELLKDEDDWRSEVNHYPWHQRVDYSEAKSGDSRAANRSRGRAPRLGRSSGTGFQGAYRAGRQRQVPAPPRASSISGAKSVLHSVEMKVERMGLMTTMAVVMQQLISSEITSYRIAPGSPAVLHPRVGRACPKRACNSLD